MRRVVIYFNYFEQWVFLADVIHTLSRARRLWTKFVLQKRYSGAHCTWRCVCVERPDSKNASPTWALPKPDINHDTKRRGDSSKPLQVRAHCHLSAALYYEDHGLQVHCKHRPIWSSGEDAKYIWLLIFFRLDGFKLLSI